MNSVLTVREALEQSSNLVGSNVWIRGVLVITSSHCHLSPSRALRNALSESIAINPKIRKILDEKTGGSWFLVGGDSFYLCESELHGVLAEVTSESYRVAFENIDAIVLVDRERGRRAEVAIEAI